MATSNLDRQTARGSSILDDDENDDLGGMSLVEHLEELRKRIFVCLIAIIIGGIIAFIFVTPIMAFLQSPLPKEADAVGHGKLVVNGLTEGFTVYLLVSLVAGFVFSLPVILYETWAFISPGLYAHEKKQAVPFIGIGLLLFLAGISLAFAVMRYPVEWLVNVASGSFTELITADSYFKFVAIFMLVFGIIFEMPLVLTFLARIGMVSVEMLTKKRSMAHVGMWIASTFVTPGADLYSPIIIGVAMSTLYELSIIFIRFTVKKTAEAEAAGDLD